jgi:hypothetical protein
VHKYLFLSFILYREGQERRDAEQRRLEGVREIEVVPYHEYER